MGRLCGYRTCGPRTCGCGTRSRCPSGKWISIVPSSAARTAVPVSSARRSPRRAGRRRGPPGWRAAVCLRNVRWSAGVWRSARRRRRVPRGGRPCRDTGPVRPVGRPAGRPRSPARAPVRPAAPPPGDLAHRCFTVPETDHPVLDVRRGPSRHGVGPDPAEGRGGRCAGNGAGGAAHRVVGGPPRCACPSTQATGAVRSLSGVVSAVADSSARRSMPLVVFSGFSFRKTTATSASSANGVAMRNSSAVATP